MLSFIRAVSCDVIVFLHRKKTPTKTETNIDVAIFAACSHTQFLQIHIQIGKKPSNHNYQIFKIGLVIWLSRSRRLLPGLIKWVPAPGLVAEDKISYKLFSDLHKSTVEVKSIINPTSDLLTQKLLKWGSEIWSKGSFGQLVHFVVQGLELKIAWMIGKANALPLSYVPALSRLIERWNFIILQTHSCYNQNPTRSWMRWHLPLVLALRKGKREDRESRSEFRPTLAYIILRFKN